MAGGGARTKIMQGGLASAFHIAVSIVVAVIQVRLIVSFLPGHLAGVWFLFLSMGALTAFLDLGLGPTVSREISFIVGRKTEELSRQQEIVDVFATAQRMFSAVAGVVFLLGLACGSYLLFRVSTGVGFREIIFAWIVFMFGSAINLWGAGVFAGLYGMGQVAPEKLIRALVQLLGVVAIFIGFQHGAGLGFLSVIWLAQAVLSRGAGWVVLCRQYPFLKELQGRYCANTARRLAHLGTWWMVTGLGSILLLQTDQMIVASVLGTTAVPSYEAVLKMMTTLSSIAVLLVTSTTPFMSMDFAAGQVRLLRRKISQNVRWAVSSMLLFGSFVVVMGDKIVALWLGPAFFVGFSTFWAVFLVFVLEVHYVSIAISTMATGRIVLYKTTLLSGLLKIILSTWLAKHLGIVGVPIGTLVAHLFTNNLYAPYVLRETVNLPLRQYFKTVLWPVVLFGTYIVSCHFLLSRLLCDWSAGASLIAAMGISVLVMLPGWYLFVLSPGEARQCKKWLRRHMVRIPRVFENHRYLKGSLSLVVAACWGLFIWALFSSTTMSMSIAGGLFLQLVLASYLVRILDVATLWHLPFVLLTGYFLTAYTGKFLLMLCLNDIKTFLIARGVPYPLALSPDLASQTAWLLMAAVVVLLVFYFILRRVPVPKLASGSSFSINHRRVYWLTVGFFLLYLSLVGLTVHFNIASMGTFQAALPYKFVGILYYARRYIVFAFLLFLQYLAYRNKKYVWIATGFTVLYIAPEFILSTSKAVIFFTVLSTLLLYYLTRVIKPRSLFVLLGALAGLVLVYPMLGVFRYGELGKALIEGNFTIDLLVSSSIAYSQYYFGGTGMLAASTLKLFSRLTGVDMLMVILNHGQTSGGENPYLYITRAVMGLSLHEAHREAPGLLGYFYLLGRTPSMLAGLFGSLCLSFLYYRVLLFLPPQPIVAAFFCMSFVMAFMDGAFDRNTVNVMLMTGVAALLLAGIFRYTCKENSKSGG